MRPGLAKSPQLGRSRGMQSERRRGDSGSAPPYREGSTPPREGSAPTVGDSVVSSGKTKSPSSGVLVSTPSSSPAAGRFTILGSMSETESVEVDSGVTEVVAGDADVLDIGVEVVGDEVVVDVEVVGGGVVEVVVVVGGDVVVEVVVEVRGRTGSIGSPFPATAAS